MLCPWRAQPGWGREARTEHTIVRGTSKLLGGPRGSIHTHCLGLQEAPLQCTFFVDGLLRLGQLTDSGILAPPGAFPALLFSDG